MSKSHLIAIGVALSTASCALAQTDPDKPWFRWLIDPQDGFATGHAWSPAHVAPDGTSVFFHGYMLEPGVQIRYGLFSAQLPIADPQLESAISQSCSLENYFQPVSSSQGGGRVMGEFYENGRLEYYFEFNAELGFSAHEVDLEGWTPFWVSPSGESHVEFGILDDEPWWRYRQVFIDGSVRELRPLVAQSTGVQFMSANDEGLAGLYRFEQDGRLFTQPALWVGGEFVGPPLLDELKDDARTYGISADGLRIIGAVQDGEQDERQRRRTRVFTWGADGVLAWLPIEFQSTNPVVMLASTDFRVVSYYVEEVVEYQSVPVSRSQLWREGREVDELKNILESEYGFDLGEFDVLLQSMSADGKIISGKAFSPFETAVVCGQSKTNLFVAHIPDPIVGDLTRDWEVNGADLAAILAAWGSADANADLDGDGIVWSSDLAMLLARWSGE